MTAGLIPAAYITDNNCNALLVYWNKLVDQTNQTSVAA